MCRINRTLFFVLLTVFLGSGSVKITNAEGIKCPDEECPSGQVCCARDSITTAVQFICAKETDEHSCGADRIAEAKDLEAYENWKSTKVTEGSAARSSMDTYDLQGDDPCRVSSNINGQYNCGKTQKTMEVANITNIAAQTIGAVATQMTGQSNLAAAQSKGTQSALMEAGGNTQVKSGQIQVTTGALNTALGLTQVVAAYKHKRHARQLDAASDDKLTVDQGTAKVSANAGNKSSSHIMDSENFDLNNAYTTATGKGVRDCAGMGGNMLAQCLPIREKELEEKRVWALRQKNYIAASSETEQLGMADKAMASGIGSVMTGATQITTGGFNIAAGNKMKKAADTLRDAEGKIGPIIDVSNSNPSNPSAPAQVPAVGGDGVTTSATAEESEEQTASVDPINLGRGLNPNDMDDKAAPGPEAGKLSHGGGGSGGGGGGVPGLGGGSTSPATGGQDEGPTSRLADSRRNSDMYEGNSGTFSGGKGGGAGAANSGPDLSSLLAQFLPKKDEEPEYKNGILDFGSRGPAGEQPVSLLDRGANIFERIHKTYQEKAEKGVVGVK